MRYDKSVTVGFSNLNPVFMKFQEQHKKLCQTISENKRSQLIKSLKMISSFYFEYRTYVLSQDLKKALDKSLYSLKKKLYENDVYNKLCLIKKKSSTEMIEFNRIYYTNLIKLLRIIGILGDELSKTLMPNKTDRTLLISYSNNNAFFDKFTMYKSVTAEKLSDFSLKHFKDSFSYFICFYFAYYLFIDERSRCVCEETFSTILNIYLNKEVLKLVINDFNRLSDENKKKYREIDFILHDGLNHIFYRCNYSYSEYNIMPRIQRRVLVDRTAI